MFGIWSNFQSLEANDLVEIWRIIEFKRGKFEFLYLFFKKKMGGIWYFLVGEFWAKEGLQHWFTKNFE